MVEMSKVTASGLLFPLHCTLSLSLFSLKTDVNLALCRPPLYSPLFTNVAGLALTGVGRGKSLLQN